MSNQLNRRGDSPSGWAVMGVIAVALAVILAVVAASGCSVLNPDATGQPSTQPTLTAQQADEIAAAQSASRLLLPPPFGEIAALAIGAFAGWLIRRRTVKGTTAIETSKTTSVTKE